MNRISSSDGSSSATVTVKISYPSIIICYIITTAEAKDIEILTTSMVKKDTQDNNGRPRIHSERHIPNISLYLHDNNISG